jgi:hypothetical protein
VQLPLVQSMEDLMQFEIEKVLSKQQVEQMVLIFVEPVESGSLYSAF